MKNLGQMLKQAQQMQQKVADMQEKLAAAEIRGESTSTAGDRVAVTLSGKGEALAVSIDPSLLEKGDVGDLEEGVRVAINDAATKMEAMKKEMMAELTGGVALPPGLQLPF